MSQSQQNAQDGGSSSSAPASKQPSDDCKPIVLNGKKIEQTDQVSEREDEQQQEEVEDEDYEFDEEGEEDEDEEEEEDEEDMEAPTEDEAPELEQDEEEYDRIANRIDQIILETNSLQMGSGQVCDSGQLDDEDDGGEEALIDRNVTPVPASQQPARPEEGDQAELHEELEIEADDSEALARALADGYVIAMHNDPDDHHEDDHHEDDHHKDDHHEDDHHKPHNVLPSRTNFTRESLDVGGALKHSVNKWNISDLADDDGYLHQGSFAPESQQRQETDVPLSDRMYINRGEDGEIDEIEIAFSNSGQDLDDNKDELNRIMEEEEDNDDEDDQDDDDDDDDEADSLMPDDLLNAMQKGQAKCVELAPLTPSPVSERPLDGCLSATSAVSQVRNLVIQGELEPLRELLDSMPNFFIDAILKAGWTALMYAAYRGYPHILKFCLERGADPNYHKDNFTSLMAVCTSSPENPEHVLLQSMQFLVKHGALVNAEDKFGCSPLHYAARFNRAQLIDYLVVNGHANINHTNQNGWSALHWAVTENKLEAIGALLDHDIDVTLKTIDGFTASRLAKLKAFHDVAHALVEIEQAKTLGKRDAQIRETDLDEELQGIDEDDPDLVAQSIEDVDKREEIQEDRANQVEASLESHNSDANKPENLSQKSQDGDEDDKKSEKSLEENKEQIKKDLEEEFEKKENLIESIINNAFQSMLDETTTTIATIATTIATTTKTTTTTSPSSPLEPAEIEIQSTQSEAVESFVPVVRQRTKEEAKATISAVLRERMKLDTLETQSQGEEVEKDGRNDAQAAETSVASYAVQFGLAVLLFFVLKYLLKL